MSEQQNEPVGVRGLLKALKMLVPMARPERWRIAFMLLIGLVNTVAEGVSTNIAILLAYELIGDSTVVDDMENGVAAFTALLKVVGRDPIVLMSVVAGAILVNAILSSLYGALAGRIANNLAHRTRSEIYSRYLNTSFDNAKKIGQNWMVNVIEFEATFIPEAVMSLAEILVHLSAIALYVLLILSISPELGGTLLGLAIVFALALTLPARWLSRRSAAVSQLNERLVGHAVSSLQVLRTIRMYGVEDAFVSKFSSLSQDAAMSRTHLNNLEQVIAPIRTVAKLAFLGIFLGVGYAIGAPIAISIGVIALLVRVAPHVSAVETLTINLMAWAAPLRIVSDTLDNVLPAEDTGAKAIAAPFQTLSLHEVSYQFPDERRPTLEGVNFSLPKGTITAIVGPSGAGKTTLVNLLARLYEPSAGEIRLNGEAISNFSRASWLKQVAFSGQDVNLIAGTVAENIAFAREGVSEETMRRLLGIAGLSKFVEELPDGLQTRIGDGGGRLSGGQRQRLSLARALAGAPDILVLDEGTNAVDRLTENEIFASLKSTFPDLTLVVITHRTGFEAADFTLRVEGRHVKVSAANPTAAGS